MIAKTKEVLKKLEFGFLELFLGFFMVIGLIGYFGSLPADLDWIDHTVAFIMFSYFFYILDISSLLFGRTVKIANLLILFSYFSLFFKDIVSYTGINAFEFSLIKFVDYFYLFFRNNLVLTNIISFYIGAIGIFAVSFYLTKKIEITHPSFLYAISKGRFKNNLSKFFLLFLTLLSFYYLVFNPILEWLEFVLDDPIVLIGIVYFAIAIAKHHHKFYERGIIFKIGDLVWGWYRKFISLFHYKKTLPLAVSGLLILHAASDIGVFAYSLIFLKENFYLEFLNEEHSPFLYLFLNDLKAVPNFVSIPLLIVYLLNALSLMIFLIIPIAVWVKIFSQKGLHFNRTLLFFIYSSAVVYLLLPAYIIKPLEKTHIPKIEATVPYSSLPGYIAKKIEIPAYGDISNLKVLISAPETDFSVQGVDILPFSIYNGKSILDAIFPNKISIIIAVSLISILFGLVIYILSHNPKIRKELYAISIIGGLTFYVIYIYHFLLSLLGNLYDGILLYIMSPHFLLALILGILFILSALFYIGGYFMFLYEIVMEYHKRKWSEPIDEELVAAIRKIKSIEMSEIAKGRFKGIFKGNKAISEHAPKPKVLDRKMIKPRKAQIVGEVFKYAMVGVVSIVVLVAGYKMIDAARERACKTEITKFEIDLRNIDKSLRFGEKELRSYDAPCKADQIYFFDLGKSINPENFNDIPLVKDTLKGGGGNNIFLVKEGELKRSFYAGNLEMGYPYNICFVPKFDRISFFIEGAGKSAKITSACGQPECTYIPVEISDEDAKKIIRDAIEFGCRNCPIDFDREVEKARLTRQQVEIFRKFSSCEGITEVQIIIRPKKGSEVKDFRFYEFIPKSCIDDLSKYLGGNIEGDVDIKSDPLILWYFKELGKEKRVSYKLNAELNDECRQAIAGLGVAQFAEGEEEGEEQQMEERQAKGRNTEPTISGLPDVTLSGLGLKKNVIRNLWKYAQDKETNPKNLVYTIIDQTNNELVDCSISNEKHLDCEVKQNKKGSSVVTIQIDDFEFTDRAGFNIEVLPFCKKHERKVCKGSAVVWLDSCDNEEEVEKVCSAGEMCMNGECKELPAQEASGPREDSAPEGCTRDSDCGFGEVCMNGECCLVGPLTGIVYNCYTP